MVRFFFSSETPKQNGGEVPKKKIETASIEKKKSETKSKPPSAATESGPINAGPLKI